MSLLGLFIAIGMLQQRSAGPHGANVDSQNGTTGPSPLRSQDVHWLVLDSHPTNTASIVEIPGDLLMLSGEG